MHMTEFSAWQALLLALLLWLPKVCGAQVTVVPAIVDGVRVFSPDDFARFAPRTALDMVQQLPGFTISEADERRGLGQATENVLINGKRISGKTNDAITALGRIPVENVLRIEILEGARLDIPGLSGQVVNIVAASSDGISGQYAWRPQFRFNGVSPRLTAGEASISGAFKDAFDYTVSIENDAFREGEEGDERVFAADDAVLDLRQEQRRISAEVPVLSVALDYTGSDDVFANLDLAYGEFDFTGRERSLRSGDGLPGRVRDLLQTEDEWNLEISGDYAFGLGAGRLKLIGFQRLEHSPTLSQVITDFDDGSSDTGTRFESVADEGESILRSEYNWKTAAGADWQVAAEGAFNFLDVESELQNLDGSGAFVPVALPGATSRVEELRAEVTATYAAALSPTWSLQGSLGGEYSELSQSGMFGQTRSFVRPKGFVALIWRPADGTSLTWRIEREVGQLGFFDFVASVNVDQDNQNAANPDLVPRQSWNGEIVATHDFGEYGSATLRLFGEWVSDIIDQIPIGPDSEAPGNLDSAMLYGLELNGTVLFDALGWNGARLDVDLALQDSSVDDPISGLPRPISGELIRQVEATLRHDIPATAWAYGATWFERREARTVRLDEINRFTATPGDLGVFVEHKDVFGATVNATLSNILDLDERFARTVFSERNNGPVAFREDRVRGFGPILNITVSGTF